MSHPQTEQFEESVEEAKQERTQLINYLHGKQD